MRTGRGGEASAQLKTLAASDDPGVQLAIGLLLQRNGRAGEASPHFHRYARVDSDGLMALAEKSVNEDDYALAMQLLDAAPDKTSAAWHALKGYSHFKLDQPQPALDHLQQAVRLDPQNEDYYLELAEYLGANNAVPTVVVVLETAARTLPKSWKIRTALGVAYLMQSTFDKAESILLSLVQADPRDDTAQRLLADCYNRSQNWPRLKQVAATLRDIAPSDAELFYGKKG